MHKDETYMRTEVNLVKIRTLAQISSLSLEYQASSKEDDSNCGLYTASWISSLAINTAPQQIRRDSNAAEGWPCH